MDNDVVDDLVEEFPARGTPLRISQVLCVVVLMLMLGAIGYLGVCAARNFNVIHV